MRDRLGDAGEESEGALLTDTDAVLDNDNDELCVMSQGVPEGEALSERLVDFDDELEAVDVDE